MDLEDEIDRLYGLDRVAFVAERDAAARRAREEGDREGAERLRALRKPTLAAWAVNRLARDRSEEVGVLLSAVDELEVAQAQAVRGDPARFRDAAEAHRGALERLVDAAERILEEADSASATTVERVRETLHAVSVEPEARALLSVGRLDHERQPGGLDALGLAGAVPVEEEGSADGRLAAEGGAAAGREAGGGAGGGKPGVRAQMRPGRSAARKPAEPGEGTGAEPARTAAFVAQEEAQRRRAATREARDSARAAERRSESARRRLERAEAAAAKAQAVREEARLIHEQAERERERAARRELELRGEG